VKQLLEQEKNDHHGTVIIVVSLFCWTQNIF